MPPRERLPPPRLPPEQPHQNQLERRNPGKACHLTGTAVRATHLHSHQEHLLGIDQETNHEVRVDIVVMGGDRYIHVIDVSVVNPSAGCYINGNQQSNLITESAARNRERIKRNHYSQVVGDPNIVVPFAIGITARFGPSARESLKEWCGVNSRMRLEFLCEVS